MRVRKKYTLLNSFVILFVLNLFSVFNIFAQNITAEADLEKHQIIIGDQVVLNLKLLQPLNETVEFPVFTNKLTDTIEIISLFKTDTTNLQNGNLLIEQKIIITAFDSGYYRIPPIAYLHNSDNSSDTIKTKPIWLKVESVQVDTTKEIKDIKSPYKAPLSFLKYCLGHWVILL